jgi:hypothetical protein
VELPARRPFSILIATTIIVATAMGCRRNRPAHQHRHYHSADNSQSGSQANQPRGLTQDETINRRPLSTQRWDGMRRVLAAASCANPLS